MELKSGNTVIAYEYDYKHRKTAALINGEVFEYNATGSPVKYRDKTLEWQYGNRLINYIYRKDIQGNIIAILDSFGAVVVKYTYDAWG